MSPGSVGGALSSEPSPPSAYPGLGRELLALALPALGALIAEPLFVLVDTALVGHLGTAELAGLGVAATVLQTAVGLMIFLAYGTTPAVARLVGAGQRRRALETGRDGVVLGAVLGAVLLVLGAWAGPWLLAGLGARDDMLPHALAYLHGSLPGLPAMLIVLSLTGVLRGLGDSATPLWAAGAGAVVNALLNWALIYGAGLGVYGSGLGTSLTQWGMAVALGFVVARHMRAAGASFTPHLAGVRASAGAGVWLVIRSAAMRASIILTLVLAANWGAEVTAGHQILNGLFALAALALDAIAIAAQTLIARELGAANRERAQAFLRLMLVWGAGFGVIAGVLLAALSPWMAQIFGQGQLHQPVMWAVLVLAVAQPLCGVVFVLDGVLIGAGDLPYLGRAAVLNLCVHAAMLGLIWWMVPAGSGAGAAAGGGSAGATLPLVLLWAAWSIGFMASRAATLWMRARGGEWIRLGGQP